MVVATFYILQRAGGAFAHPFVAASLIARDASAQLPVPERRGFARKSLYAARACSRTSSGSDANSLRKAGFV
jgi:hypothetical protein